MTQIKYYILKNKINTIVANIGQVISINIGDNNYKLGKWLGNIPKENNGDIINLNKDKEFGCVLATEYFINNENKKINYKKGIKSVFIKTSKEKGIYTFLDENNEPILVNI